MKPHDIAVRVFAIKVVKVFTKQSKELLVCMVVSVREGHVVAVADFPLVTCTWAGLTLLECELVNGHTLPHTHFDFPAELLVVRARLEHTVIGWLYALEVDRSTVGGAVEFWDGRRGTLSDQCSFGHFCGLSMYALLVCRGTL